MHLLLVSSSRNGRNLAITLLLVYSIVYIITYIYQTGIPASSISLWMLSLMHARYTVIPIAMSTTQPHANSTYYPSNPYHISTSMITIPYGTYRVDCALQLRSHVLHPQDSCYSYPKSSHICSIPWSSMVLLVNVWLHDGMSCMTNELVSWKSILIYCPP